MRVIPDLGLCTNQSCTPLYETCLKCSNFVPNPIYKDCFSSTIIILEKQVKNLEGKPNNKNSIKTIKNRITTYESFIKRIDDAERDKNASQRKNGFTNKAK